MKENNQIVCFEVETPSESRRELACFLGGVDCNHLLSYAILPHRRFHLSGAWIEIQGRSPPHCVGLDSFPQIWRGCGIKTVGWKCSHGVSPLCVGRGLNEGAEHVHGISRGYHTLFY